IIGLNTAGYVLYIELVTLGTVRLTAIEPMNVFRVAVMKNAVQVIAVHNHPSGRLEPSEADKDITDRLIQVGKILNIQLLDHFIISPTSYVSLASMGLMAALEKSLKYVPTYQLIEQIRKEEKAIAKEAIDSAKDATKVERERRQKSEQALISALLEKQVSVESIAKILDVTPQTVEKIINKKK
ncbi:MAG: JAB domain-containing protein, partial [Saezia sp.]